MSKRAGTVVTLEDLVEAVGVDAAPLRAGPLLGATRTLDIDLDLLAGSAPTTTRSSTCSTRTPGSRRSPATRPSSASRPARTFEPRCSPRERGDLLARARRVPAASSRRPPSCASRTASRATSRSWPAPTTASTTPAGSLPMGDEDDHRPAPRAAVAVRRDPAGARQRARPARRLRPGADVTDAARTRAHHEAIRPGRCTPGCCAARAAGLRPPTPRPRRAGARGVAARRRPRSVDGGSRSAGSTSATSPSATAPRRSCSTRPTSAPRARGVRRRVRRRRRVHYAGKAFLCTEVARWVAEEGLAPRRLHRRRAGRRAAGRASRRRGSRCTATTSRAPSWPPRWTRASAGSSSTRSTRSTGWTPIARERGVVGSR